MATQTHEQTINIALGELLERMGQDWRIEAERVGLIQDGGRVDILITENGGWPIALEAEVENKAQAEKEARSRLGRKTLSSHPIESAVAIVYPMYLRDYSGESLRQKLGEVTLEFVFFSSSDLSGVDRFPKTGWLSGGVKELAFLLHNVTVNESHVRNLADALASGVSRAEAQFSEFHPYPSEFGAKIAEILGQRDCDEGQTRRMAMTVIANALVFHLTLHQANFKVEDLNNNAWRTVKSPIQLWNHTVITSRPLLAEWKAILAVNYWPIFNTASRLLEILPTRTASEVLGSLLDTAEKLVAGGVTKSHDLTGVIFQRLIADRKFLATFYTRPAAASLLAGMAIPFKSSYETVNQNGIESASDTRIGDFACGTGTLLSTAYRRICILNETSGIDPKRLHQKFMRDGLVGLDVLNVAVHLTATMLAGAYPSTTFEGECLLTMPYGNQKWGLAVGSLDLISRQTSIDLIEAAAKTSGGRGEELVTNIIDRVRHGQFDIVIMNPPFTRHGAREGDRTSVHNPAFAAFETSDSDQDLLTNHLKKIDSTNGGAAHGHAGLASYFVDLAHVKVKESGMTALVLPLSAISGQSWEKTRVRWRERYSDIRVVTISEKDSNTRSFSADTGMAECLFVGRKLASKNQAPRGYFAVLRRQPQSNIEGTYVAKALEDCIATNSVRKLEGGPFGGSRLKVGDECVGEVVDCSLPPQGAWPLAGISDITLAQTAYQLESGRVWIAGMLEEDCEIVPVHQMNKIFDRVGPHHLDIVGALKKSDGLPQGPFERFDGVQRGAEYPCLWSHDSERERQLVVEPDSHCRIRDIEGQVPYKLRERAAVRWGTATRAHYNLDLQFNSQSLLVSMTPQRCIGGRAWPSVIFPDEKYEYAFSLWCNSTLGLLCHWWMSNKTQSGRGCTTITGIGLIPSLDVRVLSESQHSDAKSIFDALAGHRFLPFNQINEDPARAELDQLFFTRVLGFNSKFCAQGGPIDLLRQKLAAEPQISGNKQSRVDFSSDTDAGNLSEYEEM